MRINFISHNTDLNRGSYRIHVRDLNDYFNQCNFNSSINNNEFSDVSILDKGLNLNFHKSHLVGMITPNLEDYQQVKNADFCIVGSAEERDSLISYNKNIFIFPQIEQSYLNKTQKKHVKKELITLGYHGNPQHLNHFSLSLNRALDKIAKKYNIELIIFKSKISSMSDWVTEKPNIPIKYIDFDLKTFSSNIYNFDIGLVPNISEFTIGNQEECSTKGMYHSDFKIRFKNKSNIGRALVLIQHGIPVICDVTPSNMSIFHDPNNGYAVLSEDGWYNSIESLIDHKERNRVAKNAHKQYSKLYDPIYWAKDLHKKIKNIYYDKIKNL